MEEEENMKKQKNRSWFVWKAFPFLIVLVVISAAPSAAEDPAKFPTRPITFVVPWAAGGGGDLTCRKMADSVSKTLGQAILPVNKPGGGGVIGMTSMLSADPDGYTICHVSHSTAVIIPHVRQVSYNTKQDFSWIMAYAEFQFTFSVLADSPYKTLKDLIEDARKNPGKLSYTTGGPLTSQHIFLEYVFSTEKVKLNHVPVGGGIESATQLLGGHVAAALSDMMVPHIKAGKARPLAILGGQRIADFLDVPTFYELGYKLEFPLWMGLMAPKGVHPLILSKFSDAFKKAYDDPSFQRYLTSLYFRPFFKDSESFKTIVFRDYDASGQLIKQLGLVK
jgi:tripartite-type tricarboxylate transporter receptor subunit TctC